MLGSGVNKERDTVLYPCVTEDVVGIVHIMCVYWCWEVAVIFKSTISV